MPGSERDGTEPRRPGPWAANPASGPDHPQRDIVGLGVNRPRAGTGAISRACVGVLSDDFHWQLEPAYVYRILNQRFCGASRDSHGPLKARARSCTCLSKSFRGNA
jgi:hypothetical protein